MNDLQLLIPTLFGLEGVCANELRRLGLEDVVPAMEEIDFATAPEAVRKA